MNVDSLFPLKGKKCVISDISLEEAEVETTLDHEAIKKYFRMELFRNLREYGIEVVDSSLADKQNINIVIQAIKLIQGKSDKIILLDIFESYRHISYSDTIVKVKSNILTDAGELPEVFAKVEKNTNYDSQVIFRECLSLAAEMLSSQINAALIDHYLKN